MSNSWKDVLIINGLGHENGQGFTMALIVLAVTALLSVPLLGFLSSVLHRSSAQNAALDAQYSVDAGTEDALWRVAYDSGFMQQLMTGNSQTYSIVVNGKPVSTTVKSAIPGGVPPAPAPTPTPRPGLSPLIWTSVCLPALYQVCPPNAYQLWYDLAPPALPLVRVTIYLRNGANSQDTISEIYEVLHRLPPLVPPGPAAPLDGYRYSGFEYVPGTIRNQDLVKKVGNNYIPYSDSELEQQMIKSWGPWNPSSPPFPWANPYPPKNADGTCVTETTYQAPYQAAPNLLEQQRIEWTWANNDRPRVQPGNPPPHDASLTFDMVLKTPKPGVYGDSAWGHSTQNQCVGGQETHKGRGSWVIIRGQFVLTASQGATTNLISELESEDKTKITAQSFGD